MRTIWKELAQASRNIAIVHDGLPVGCNRQSNLKIAMSDFRSSEDHFSSSNNFLDASQSIIGELQRANEYQVFLGFGGGQLENKL